MQTLIAAAAAHPLVHVDATLNMVATLLLIAGLMLIRRGKEIAHKWVMLAAFAVSCAFLTCYLWYHLQVGGVKFTHTGIVRTIYFAVLIPHIILAATVPFLAITTIVLGFRAMQPAESSIILSRRQRHRRWARITFPVWLYVSVTGVIVYLMLYHLYPPADG